MTISLAEHISAAVRARGPQPFLTFHGSDGERTELSYATFDNWASKTANWLVEEEGLERGDTCAVAATDGWRTAVTMAGCWKAGIAVDASGGDGLVATDDVLAYADDYDDPDVDPSAPALRVGGDTTSAQDVIAEAPRIPGRARVATALAASDPQLWRLLVGVLLARGALVWAPGAADDALAAHAESERATHVYDAGGLRDA